METKGQEKIKTCWLMWEIINPRVIKLIVTRDGLSIFNRNFCNPGGNKFESYSIYNFVEMWKEKFIKLLP